MWNASLKVFYQYYLGLSITCIDMYRDLVCYTLEPAILNTLSLLLVPGIHIAYKGGTLVEVTLLAAELG